MNLVFHPAQPLGAAAAVPVFQQQLLSLGAAVGEGCFQPLRHQRAQFLVAAAMGLDQVFQFGGQRARIDQVIRAPGRVLGRGARTVIDGEGGHAHPIAEAEW